MNVMVVYASALGATREIAERIGATLRQQGSTVAVESAESLSGGVVDESWDAFIIGSAVHGGHWLPAATRFVERHAEVLSQRPVWLFSSGPVGERYVHLPQPDPKEVPNLSRLIRARGHTVFAGAFDRQSADLRALSFVERAVVTRWLPVGDFRDWGAIEGWSTQISRDLRSLPAPAAV